MKVDFVQHTKLFDLRRDVLGWKAPYTIDVDMDENTFHLGTFVENELISIGTFAKQNNPQFTFQHQYRLRGMATNKAYSGLGSGRKLLAFAEEELRNRNIELLWFDARIVALEFYKKLNYTAIGEAYPVRDVGMHYLMYKVL